MKNLRLKNQSGFTLVELLVALVILTILAVTVTGAFDGSRSRAQAMVNAMAEIGNANIRLKNDTGCYTNRPDALYNQAVGVLPASNYCNRDFTSTWNGPYLSKFTATEAGSARLDKVSANVEVALVQEAGGMGRRYLTRATNLPNDVVKQALQECNNDVTESGDSAYFDNHKCRGQTDGATDGNGVFEMVYDETR